MMSSLYKLSFIFAFFLTVVSGKPRLLGFSSNAHFKCILSSTNPCTFPTSPTTASLLPKLINHVNGEKQQATTELFSQHEKLQKPTMIIIVHSTESMMDPSSLISRSSSAISSTQQSAFNSESDNLISESSLHFINSYHLPSVDDFVTLIHDSSANVKPIVDIPISTNTQMETFFNTLRLISKRLDHSNDVAIIFSIHDGDTNGSSDGTIMNNGMRPPEITVAQLTGLLVGLVFLMIFIPGFLCLWRIQTPQTFAMLDSNDLQKKVQ